MAKCAKAAFDFAHNADISNRRFYQFLPPTQTRQVSDILGKRFLFNAVFARGSANIYCPLCVEIKSFKFNALPYLF